MPIPRSMDELRRMTEEVAVHFTVPAHAQLRNACSFRVVTTVETQVQVRLIAGRHHDVPCLAVTMDPPLLIDINFRLVEDVRFHGFVYRLGNSPGVESVDLERIPSLIGIDPTERVRRGIEAAVEESVLGSLLSRGGSIPGPRPSMTRSSGARAAAPPIQYTAWDPFEDPDLMGTLRTLGDDFAGRFHREGRAGNSPVGNLTGLGGQIRIRFATAATEGPIEVPAGTAATLTLQLQGTTSDILDGRVQVDYVDVSTDGIYLVHEDQRLILFRRLRVAHRGQVQILEIEQLDSADPARLRRCLDALGIQIAAGVASIAVSIAQLSNSDRLRRMLAIPLNALYCSHRAQILSTFYFAHADQLDEFFGFRCE